MRHEASTETITRAAELLRQGELVAFPTETVYGLGADARNEAAVQKIFAAKGRPSNNPLIVHVASIDQALSVTDISRCNDPEITRQRLAALSALWPGPLSVILPKGNQIAAAVTGGGDTIAVRIPRHPVALELIRGFAGPIAAPSANRSMYVSPTTAAHVEDGLGDRVAMILDGGACEIGLESTVLSLMSTTPRILRPGAVTQEILSQALGCAVESGHISVTSPSPLLSPGLLAKHYSPRTPVVLRSAVTAQTPLTAAVGFILFSDEPAPFSAAQIRVLSETRDLNEIAAALFAALRELDQMNLDLIIVDVCEPVGLGEAIMDRLIRATSDSGK